MADVLQTTVAVLGAGWAGVSAGHELFLAGVDDFVIVEGGNHIGGRSRKADFGGYVVEDGSNWIQGTSNTQTGATNPIWDLAVRYGVEKIKKKKHPFKNVGGGTVTQNYESYVVYDENGSPVTDQTIRWDDLEGAIDCVADAGIDLNLEYWADGTLAGPPLPTQRDQLDGCGWTPVTPVDDVIEWWEYDWEWGRDPTHGSGYDPVFGYAEYDDDDELVVDQRGFQYLAERLAGEYLESSDGTITDDRLMMNTLVTNIDYDPRKGNNQSDCPDEFQSTGCVKVTTDQGITIVAQYAIVTFSSRVILDGHDTLFSPDLPDTNRVAIESVNPGVYTKIFFQFEHKFWEDVEFILTATNERGRSALWQNLDINKHLPGSKIIFQTLVADLGAGAEAADEQDVVNEQMSFLRKVYGDDIPDPINVHIARFRTDPLFLEGWADWGPYTTPDVSDRMRAPFNNKFGQRNVYISGEATCRRYHGYTNGAFLAGKRDAREVLIALGYQVETEEACESTDAPPCGPPYGHCP